jgi:hypothetical protein
MPRIAAQLHLPAVGVRTGVLHDRCQDFDELTSFLEQRLGGGLQRASRSNYEQQPVSSLTRFLQGDAGFCDEVTGFVCPADASARFAPMLVPAANNWSSRRSVVRRRSSAVSQKPITAQANLNARS